LGGFGFFFAPHHFETPPWLGAFAWAMRFRFYAPYQSILLDYVNFAICAYY
jgi:hypothetical protein